MQTLVENNCERISYGKEYNLCNNLIFEGYYSNGKRKGKGKEYYYYNGKLIFEGEYSNWKRSGKGKKYDQLGRLKFEGEYSNGERNGKGKEYIFIMEVYIMKENIQMEKEMEMEKNIIFMKLMKKEK